VSSKYEFIDAEKDDYPITKMCDWLDVSRSGFHEWRDREESATTKRQEKLKLLIQHVFTDSDGTYGYRRVHAELARLGVHAGDELVRRLTGAPFSCPTRSARSSVRGFGRTPGPHRAIALLARPSRSSMSSARPGGPGHPDWLQGCAPSSADQ
jgi:hypothetical protein